ncbi:hypothetical protein BFF78_11225 [Streptomyces fodineus]|uniref:NAD-dependent epimerase/dehydratase domain-containing protein n=1 Tax=Streptomyces fodineus TaxID=1904616 RepID=A0A1D7Y859_9ACTN|nr:NAD(P)-dependent oxidoreductase [Streptomyces fodineus]AOR31539.1 hypothetical protein BFF78_11225 [Streptomyces fodineus]
MTSGPVLVLGGSGYLGRHICAAFVCAGATVVQVSRNTPDRTVPGAVRMDLAAASPAELARLCADTGARVLVNAAGVGWGGSDRQMEQLNVEFVGRLTEVVAGLPRPPRLIQLGSAYEYGPSRHGETIDEDWPPAPESSYARMKLRGSQAVLRAAEQGVDGVVLRLSVVCGPGTPRTSLPGLVAARLAAGHEELRLAPLRDYRDLVDVRDVADAVVATARAPASLVTGRVVNIGRGAAVPVRRLVELLISYSGRPLRVVEERAAEPSPRSDMPWLQLDVTRARDLLGWTPRRTLEESLKDLLAEVGCGPKDG